MHYLLLLFFCVQVAFGQLNISPQYPSPGDEITLTYDATETELKDVAELEFILYSFDENEDRPIAHLVPHHKSDDGAIATFLTNASTKLISVVVRDASDREVMDNNDKKGYQKLMCSGEEPIKGAYLKKASLKGSWGGLFGLDRDQEKAVVLMEKEVKMHGPLSDEDHMMYLRTLNRVDEEKASSAIIATIDKMKAVKRPDEEQLMKIKSLYDLAKDTEGAERIAKKIKKKFPGGEFENSSNIDAYFDTKDWDEKVKLYHAINPDKLSENAKNTYQYMASNLATHFSSEGDFDKFGEYMDKVEDPMRIASAYNSAAWKMSGETLDATPSHAEKGLELSRKSLELLEDFYADESNRPNYYIMKDWKYNMKYSQGMYSDTYALLSYHVGNMEEALKYQQASCELTDFDDPGMNERYTLFYEKVKGPKAAGEIIENLIREGHASQKMRDQFRKIFVEHYSKEDVYNKYMAELEKESRRKLEEELMEQMIDLESPSFVLKNLDGEEISLESLKGKVVVLDFWATWCGPCIKSFPGMQQAVDKYADDPEVEFLFVDTWQSEENKEENARKFLDENEYNFHVLMDNEDKVVADYKVSGIPTKFILDKNQRIRFKSIGFSGSDEKLVNELTLMIDYLKKENNKNKVSMK